MYRSLSRKKFPIVTFFCILHSLVKKQNFLFSMLFYFFNKTKNINIIKKCLNRKFVDLI